MSRKSLKARRKYSSKLVAMILSILLVLPSIPVYAETDDGNNVVVNQQENPGEEAGEGKETEENPEEGKLSEEDDESEGEEELPDEDASEDEDGLPADDEESEEDEELTEGEEEQPDESRLEGGEVLPGEILPDTVLGLIQAMGAYILPATAGTESDLTDAIADAGSVPSVIDITASIDLTDVIEIPAGSNITLISTTGEVILSDEGKRHFEVYGSLTLGAGITLDGGTNGSPNGSNASGGGIEGKTDSEITLDGGVIQYCTAGNGGGIYAVNSDVKVLDGTIQECTATTDGGGVYISINTSVNKATSGLIMSGGTIKNNTARNGGGVYISVGFSVSNRSDYGLDISGGAITGNKATSGGGVYQVLGTINISDNAEISYNEADRWGGGVDTNSAAIIMTGGSVEYNISYSNSGSGGGGISSHGQTGAVAPSLTVTGGSISYNKAEGSGGDGGGIHWNGYNGEILKIENAQLIGNEAKGTGGALNLLNSLNLVIEDSVLKENSGVAGGAINIVVQSQKKMTAEIGSNVSFIDNKAVTEGGAIFLQDETIESDGAKLSIQGENIVFRDNKVIGASVGYGGSIYMMDYMQKMGIFSIKGTEDSPVLFDNNGIETDATGTGGAIFAYSYIDAENVTFKNNNIKSQGASGNNGGGAVYSIYGSNFVNCDFYKNTIEASGGADGNGGGVFVHSLGTGNFIDCSFEENSAIQGGGIYMAGSVHLENVLIEENYADKDGGGIFVKIEGIKATDYNTLTAEKVTFNDNTAGNGAFAFDLTGDGEIADTHAANLIDIVSLSLPFGLGRTDLLGFAYNKAINNYDINYVSGKVPNGVVYHPNGGDGNIHGVEVLSGDNHDVLDNDTDINLGYTRDGYEFLGWSKTKDGDADYTGGETISSITENVYLYAQWKSTAKMTKAVDKTTAKTGDILTYTINVPGAGNRQWTGLFTDALDGNVTYTGNYSIQVWKNGAWEPSSVQLKEAGGTLSADLTIEPDSAYLIEFTVTINKSAGGKTVTNTAVLTGSGGSADSVSNTVTTKVQADEVKEPGDGDGENEGNKNSGGGGYVSVNNNKKDSNKEVEQSVVPERNSDLNYDDHFAYVVGYPDGNVRPENNITRAEAATIFFRLITDEARNRNRTIENSFNDVNEEDWFNIAVSTMNKMGIISGYPDGSFRPGNNITRAELATITALFAAEKGSGSIHFSDTTGHWAQGFVEQAAALGWVSGYPDGSYRPNTYITRAEVMSMVNRMMERVPENTEDLLEDMIHWPDNGDLGSWYYIAVQEATNSHNYERKTEGYYETWISLRENRDWIKLESPLYWNK